MATVARIHNIFGMFVEICRPVEFILYIPLHIFASTQSRIDLEITLIIFILHLQTTLNYVQNVRLNTLLSNPLMISGVVSTDKAFHPFYTITSIIISIGTIAYSVISLLEPKDPGYLFYIFILVIIRQSCHLAFQLMRSVIISCHLEAAYLGLEKGENVTAVARTEGGCKNTYRFSFSHDELVV